MNAADRIRMMGLVPSMLCSADAEEGGDQGGGDGEAPALTDAQRKEIARLQNAAQSAHWSRMTKTFEGKMDELRNEFAGKLDGVLEKFGSNGESANSNGKGNKGKSGGADVSEEVKKLQAQYEARVAEMEKKWEAEKTARETERQQAQRQEERGNLAEALRAAGVDDGRIRAAVVLLHTEDKRIGRDDDGKVVYVAQREGYTENLPLDKGVEEWLKSAEGKHFAPARNASGSGAMPGRPPSGKGGKPSKAELKRNLVRAILSAEQP